VPIIDVAPLVAFYAALVDDGSVAAASAGAAPLSHYTIPTPVAAVAAEIRAACRRVGFFYVTGHGVCESLQAELHDLSHAFFALLPAVKSEIDMQHGGRAWRGFFPVGGEVTSGVPDVKEGVYFGAEYAVNATANVTANANATATATATAAAATAAAAVAAAVITGSDGRLLPLHGKNQFPDSHVPEYRRVVTEYMAAVTALAHALMCGVALSLRLSDPLHFRRARAPANDTNGDADADANVDVDADAGADADDVGCRGVMAPEPVTLFRVFHYPRAAPQTVIDAVDAARKASRLCSGDDDGDDDGDNDGDDDGTAWGVGEHTDYGGRGSECSCDVYLCSLLSAHTNLTIKYTTPFLQCLRF
jgi:isopenicillin N synthase-like dioxygenase